MIVGQGIELLLIAQTSEFGIGPVQPLRPSVAVIVHPGDNDVPWITYQMNDPGFRVLQQPRQVCEVGMVVENNGRRCRFTLFGFSCFEEGYLEAGSNLFEHSAHPNGPCLVMGPNHCKSIHGALGSDSCC